jgi:hypothetical protein
VFGSQTPPESFSSTPFPISLEQVELRAKHAGAPWPAVVARTLQGGRHFVAVVVPLPGGRDGAPKVDAGVRAAGIRTITT